MAAGSATFEYDARGRRSQVVDGVTRSFVLRRNERHSGGHGRNRRDEHDRRTEHRDVFARSSTTATEYFLKGVIGSTVSLTGSEGSIVTSYTYEPFGNTSAEGSASSNAAQFAGREHDGSGLYYY